MELTKEHYCKIVNRIVNDGKVANQMQDLLRDNDIRFDFFDPYCLFDRNVSDVLDLLEIATNDVLGWTSYWCLECEGDPDKFEAYDENDKRICILNSDDLYEYIVNDWYKYN